MSTGVLVIGEALVDVVHRADGHIDESPGGSPANVALALGRLGHSPLFLTQLGDDAHGMQLREWLADAGVRVQALPTPRTATAIARLDPTGSARYEFDIDWSLGGDIAPAGPVGIVHTGSIAASLAPGADVLYRHLSRVRGSSLITYDPNVRPALLPDHRAAVADVERFLALADVVKASDEDLAWMYPDADPIGIASSWLQRGPSLVVITLAERGALCITPDAVVRSRAERVTVADTVGAGDTFMGALIHCLTRLGLDSAEARGRLRDIDEAAIAKLLEFASRAAAITVSRPGADPPRISELEQVDSQGQAL